MKPSLAFAPLVVARRELEQHLQDAQRLLGGRVDSEATRETERLLGRVEELLASLATTAGDDLGSMAELLALRDGLSSHLLAAASCAEVDAPSHVVASVLRRAADVTERGLHRLADAV